MFGFEVADDKYTDYQNTLRYFAGLKTTSDSPLPLPDMDRQSDLEAWSKENDVTQEELEYLKKNGYSAKNSIEELTNAIVKMRQENTPVNPSFSEAWNFLDNTEVEGYKNLKNNLLELAEAGKLTDNTFKMTNGAKEWAKEFGINVDEAVIKINKFADSSNSFQN